MAKRKEVLSEQSLKRIRSLIQRIGLEEAREIVAVRNTEEIQNARNQRERDRIERRQISEIKQRLGLARNVSKDSVLAQYRLLKRVLSEIEQPTNPELIQTISETWNIEALRRLADLAIRLANAVLQGNQREIEMFANEIREIQRELGIQIEEPELTEETEETEEDIEETEEDIEDTEDTEETEELTEEDFEDIEEDTGYEGIEENGVVEESKLTVRDTSYNREMIDGTLAQHGRREIIFEPPIDKDCATAMAYQIVDSIYPGILNSLNFGLAKLGLGRFYVNIVSDEMAVSATQYSTFVAIRNLDLSRKGFMGLLLQGLYRLTSGKTISLISFTITIM